MHLTSISIWSLLIVTMLNAGIVDARRNTIEEEPTCLSRYDYDYKLLRKLVSLENTQTQLLEQVKEQHQIIDDMKKSAKDTQTHIRRLQDTVNHLTTVTSLEGIGTTYVRWGRSSCPGNGTKLVYKGYAAGSHYTEGGGAAEYICLPEEPLWDHYEGADQSTSGTIYGVEYELDQRTLAGFFGSDIRQNDAPCAVCRSPHASVLMIPGRNECYESWDLEYNGYLVSGYGGHAASSEYVCLDREPETMPGGHENHNGKLFYFTEARCGSLRCPPYVSGRELTCAVCSK